MGQKSAAYLDDIGAIAAFYDDSRASEGALTVNIVDSQWHTCLARPRQWHVDNGVLAAVPQSADTVLAAAQTAQMLRLNTAYATTVQQPVTFKTAAGVSAEFDTDSDSQTILMQATQGYVLANAVPSDVRWVPTDNTRVPVTLVGLRDLYQTMLAQG
ncbi:hypothetical protein [Burkholderia gladioli]|uniref:DUF4376 domain-containing protein n=1 Tax=Burkholderia gladioli TaxID=28095 RepID=UPI0016412264|nr:hypothetical protein [Burkholderia gladioli]